MSGKTTFLKQIALIVIMGSCGSFVPADYASLKHFTTLSTRFSNDDDADHNLSTFASEMRATASALSSAGPSSLILMDELGRGTSPTEGFGIAHAVSERLYQQKAYVFFATHFLDLEKSLGSKSRLHTQHLSFAVSDDMAGANSHLTFRYKLSDGPPRARHYGLDVASISGLPRALLEDALECSSILEHPRHKDGIASRSKHSLDRMTCLLRLEKVLQQLLHESALDGGPLLHLLAASRSDCIEAMSAQAQQW
ncbi:P-loop containing nucleoside triphosphate hydrolase protein [Microstroma glucosiphilum]|uniref:P-loop containing nucleoside triphosphate hydrolase protein n=1 Tax=Pseudomicrostroma glucosiphilum TaxID=1684307 RepID=A0A316UD07_9BASI|nr:P-loop containing nucleoside triphosphate hydrolase protein [Pseudomicrostroma glucosiphilum]PWN23110.1 P-loop containing nucleoside triphosphate hydrolase protein [Pseudomicrostroma glucosiphilum]